jgi:ActR/RegA family two-component response regulator
MAQICETPFVRIDIQLEQGNGIHTLQQLQKRFDSSHIFVLSWTCNASSAAEMISGESWAP